MSQRHGGRRPDDGAGCLLLVLGSEPTLHAGLGAALPDPLGLRAPRPVTQEGGGGLPAVLSFPVPSVFRSECSFSPKAVC